MKCCSTTTIITPRPFKNNISTLTHKCPDLQVLGLINNNWFIIIILIPGKEMAPVLGVPPPPPPVPHTGPDGLILPRKPYNPCMTSGNHKDLHRELMFNKKMWVTIIFEIKQKIYQIIIFIRALLTGAKMCSTKRANSNELWRNTERTLPDVKLKKSKRRATKTTQEPPCNEPLNWGHWNCDQRYK